MKYLIVVLLILASVASARDLTLEQALRLAEGHSNTLKSAEADRLSAEKLVSAAIAERFPTLSLAASAKYVNKVPALNINVPGFIQLSRDFGSKDSYQTDLRLSLPIYTGGRISSAVATAGSNRDYRAAMTAVERDHLFLQTRLEYFDLYRSVELQRAAQASLHRAQIVQDDVRASYNAGVADSVDLLDARLAFTKAEFQVRQAEINLRSQSIRLLSDLGLPASEQLELIDTLPIPPDSLNKPATTWVRPELEAAQSIVKLNQARVISERAGYLPTLAAYGGYSYGKPNIDPFSNKWNDNFTVGAQLQWSFNLGGSTPSKKASASFNLEAARRNRDNVSESLSRESDLAQEQLRLALEQYLSSRSELEVTTASFALARAEHQSGALSSNRLLEIEAALSQAEATHAAARVDFYIAQSAYYFAVADEKLGKGL